MDIEKIVITASGIISVVVITYCIFAKPKGYRKPDKTSQKATGISICRHCKLMLPASSKPLAKCPHCGKPLGSK